MHRLGKGVENVPAVGGGLFQQTRAFGQAGRIECSGRVLHSPPGIDVRGKPGAPVPYVLEVAWREQAAFDFADWRKPGLRNSAPALANNPLAALYDIGGGAFEPGVIAGVPVMLTEAPEHEAVVLIISSRLVACRTVELAFGGREVTRQAYRALVVQPGFKGPLGPLVVSTTVEVTDHHARFITVRTVGEGTDPCHVTVAGSHLTVGV